MWSGIFLCLVISRVELIRKDKEKFRSARKILPNGKPVLWCKLGFCYFCDHKFNGISHFKLQSGSTIFYFDLNISYYGKYLWQAYAVQCGKFVSRSGYLRGTILMLSIYLLLNFRNLQRAISKLSRQVRSINASIYFFVDRFRFFRRCPTVVCSTNKCCQS